MIRIYRADDFEFRGCAIGKKSLRIIEFPEDLSDRPEEFREKSFVELLTENERTIYSLRQINFDEKAGIYYPESFAVNYGALRLDSWPLVRGFMPIVPKEQGQILYEVMPRKKEIHVIPNPSRWLFYEEGKVSPLNTFYFEGTLDDVLEEFRLAGFSMKEFPPGFNSITNRENKKRYLQEDGF
jgi:hypothetical protein